MPASPTSARPTPRSRRCSAKACCCWCTARSPMPTIDLFDREAVFIDRVLQPLRRDFPGLKIVFEHITTREAAQYVAASDARHWRRPSPRTTCCSTATPSSWAACGRTTTACRCSSARSIAGRWCAAATSGIAEVLPRHRQRAARGGAEGACRRLRRLLHRAVGARAVRRGLRGGRRAGQAGRLRQLPRRRLLRPAAQPRPHHAAARALDAARERCPSARSSSSRCAAARP